MALLEEHGSDAVRYWAAKGGPGVDTAFEPGQMKVGRRLATRTRWATPSPLPLRAMSRTTPAGSSFQPAPKVTLKVTAIKPSENKSDKTGTLTLQPTSININGQSYPLSATIESVETPSCKGGNQRG